MRVDVNDGVGQAAVREVLVDGQPVKWCTYADTEEGYVERTKQDGNGKMMTVDSNHGTRIVTEALFGNVELVFAPGWGMDSENQYHFNGERIESRQVR